MRFMLLVKASRESEAGIMPSEEALAAMAKFNEEMLGSGVMLAGDGLQPSSKGARVDFSGGKPTVSDGPFAETKELVAGYWIIQAASLEEAIDWARRAPFEDGQIEVRRIFELSDFGESDAVDHHKRLRERMTAG